MRTDARAAQTALTAETLYGLQLRSIYGVSSERARAIMARFPSMRALLDAYARCGSAAEQEALLRTLPYGRASKPLGVACSRTVRTVLCSEDYATEAPSASATGAVDVDDED